VSRERAKRSTTSGRVYLALQAKARHERRNTDELLQLYVLEGFLDRLAASPHASGLILKGGVLLAAYELRRPTRDVDLQARSVANDAESILAMVREVVAVERDDGLVFSPGTAAAEVIRDVEEYSGVRVSLRCTLASAKLAFQVDVNVGDPIWPAPRTISLPRLLGGQLTLVGYPVAMIHAEKLVTALQRGIANTRWRDFADMYLLTRKHGVSGAELVGALRQVAKYRKAELASLSTVLAGYATVAQARWSAWRRQQQLEDRLPAEFRELIEFVVRFSEPALLGAVSDKTWSPVGATWA
jgi:hypothetical protein